MRRLVYYKGFVTLMRTELGVCKTCFFYEASHHIKSIHLKNSKKKYKYIEKYIFHIKILLLLLFLGISRQVHTDKPSQRDQCILQCSGHKRVINAKIPRPSSYQGRQKMPKSLRVGTTRSVVHTMQVEEGLCSFWKTRRFT